MRSVAFLLFLVLGFEQAMAQFSVRIDTILMGSSFSFIAVNDDSSKAISAIEAARLEVIRIESLISSWDKNSKTSKINRQAGISPVKVSEELLELIDRCKKISEISNGYFDISFASLNPIWTFDGRDMKAPDSTQVSESVKFINFRNISIDRNKQTVFLENTGMSIGFGGIGKGYAANRAKETLVSLGIESGIVNAGGDAIAWGVQVDGNPWSVGIADPQQPDKVISWLDITDQAVVTSGSYEKYVMIDDVRHGHIINPKTGWPASGMLSVTVVCPDAELADALATTVFVLGVKDGLQFVNHLKDVEAILIDDLGNPHYSKNIKTRLF